MSEIKHLIEKFVETQMDREDPQDICDPACPYCRGRGVVDGDWVPYGSTEVQLPAIFCECVYDHLWDKAVEMMESGDLVIRDGDLVFAD